MDLALNGETQAIRLQAARLVLAYALGAPESIGTPKKGKPATERIEVEEREESDGDQS